ncbi:MAG: transhydrogenase (AB-specific) [Rickettsiaceae bacterium]|jgi:NAD(P) transhydrogenase subunit alpha|nr:transhydrogenase (AB-specific) [Rickettsiaceae bacterium]
MKLAVIKERAANETRVAVTPETVKNLTDLGISVTIEKNAGVTAGISDDDYKNAGGKIGTDVDKILSAADIVLKVQAPSTALIAHMKEGTILVGLLASTQDPALIKKYATSKISAFAMEYIPRITRAQNMDVLSSQSNLAGYKAVIDALAEFGRVVPMMMTAAGSIRPAKVLVLGAGVAGLQAIATAKRMGAIVSAFDVRSAAKEQVQSLGAAFIEVEAEKSEEGEVKGGYAKEMSEAYKRKQADLIHKTLKEQDIIICTALIPGRPAPVLITEKMVKDMKPGSIIVDLATASGGNCELSEQNKVVEKLGVKLIGYDNMPARVPVDASRLYAKNLVNFLTPMVNKKLQKIKIDFEDQIIQSCLLTHDGRIVHPSLTKGTK